MCVCGFEYTVSVVGDREWAFGDSGCWFAGADPQARGLPCCVARISLGRESRSCPPGGPFRGAFPPALWGAPVVLPLRQNLVESVEKKS